MTLTQKINGGLRKVPAWPLYILGLLPPVWLFYQAVIGALGVDPVKTMEHQMGEWGLQLLIVSLMITPIRKHVGLNLVKYRRAIGLLAFFYILGHLMVWLGLDIQFRWGEIWKDILKRPAITIGMVGFVVMVPLALTSWNGVIRRMGAAAWQRLHKLAYLAVLAGGIHYVMVVKTWQTEPLLYLTVILALLMLRAKLQRWRSAPQKV
jgi:methionine sulfoxide reductase heme-binding subunit